MKKYILFIQGAGEGAYKEDQLLVNNLNQKLQAEYKIIYPEMPDEDDASYEQWREELIHELSQIKGNIILVGHSVGGSVLAKFLSEKTHQSINGIFLISAPFWGGNGWLYEGYKELELPKDITEQFSLNIPLFLYHAIDDEIVPFNHLFLYAELIPHATVREIHQGGHQLNGDLSLVAQDIESLKLTPDTNKS